MNDPLVNLAEQFVRQFYLEHNVSDNHYHNIEHTVRVVDVSRALAQAMNIGDQLLVELLIAGWFHDTGYCVSRMNHEERSAEIARSFLQAQELKNDAIELIEQLILCTSRQFEPTTDSMRIIRDADLHYIGKPSFFDLCRKLRLEWEEFDNHPFSEEEWQKTNVRFFLAHRWYTPLAHDWFDDLKQENLRIVRGLAKGKNHPL